MSSIIVNRDEFTRQVWETPMLRLVAQYGILGNGLPKICDRLNIPYPRPAATARQHLSRWHRHPHSMQPQTCNGPSLRLAQNVGQAT